MPDVKTDTVPAPEPSRLEQLRAELKKLAPHVKVERVEAVPDAKDAPGSKAHVKASWDRKRVAHVVEPPHSLDDAEMAVLSVVIAQFKVA